MRGFALPTVLLAIVAVTTHAATYTFSGTASGTYTWSSGTSWDAVPVSASDTILTYSGNLAGGTAVVSTNDTGSGNFLLNRLNFNDANTANTTPVPTLTIAGAPLEFGGASAQLVYGPTGGTTAGNRPQLIINNDIVLSSALTVVGGAAGPTPSVILGGAISGDYALTFQGTSGQATSCALANPGNSYTGDTRVYYSSSSGRDTILRLAASNVVPNGAGKGNLYLTAPSEAGSAIVQLYGNNETVNGLVSTLATGANGPAGVMVVRNAASGAATLTVGDNDTTATYYGTLQNGASGALGLTKIGAGTQTLAGLSTHTGSTTVSDGTLKIDYTQVGTSRTAGPANYFTTGSGLALSGGATFAIQGREDGGGYYQEGYVSPAYNRVLNIPNASAATLVVGQPVNLTKTGGTGTLGAVGDSYCIQAFGTPGATTTPVYMNSRVVSASGLTCTIDIPATIATTTQTVASVTLSGAAGSTATLDFGSSDNVTLTVSAAPVQTNDGSKLKIVNWNGTPKTGGGGDRLIFTGEPTAFSGVFSQSEVVFDGYAAGYELIDLGSTYEVAARLPSGGTVVLVY